MRLKSLNSVHYIKEDDTFTPIQLQVIGYDNKPFDLSEAEEIVVKIGISDGMLAQKKLSDGTLTRMEVTGGLEFRLDVDDQLMRGANFIEVQGTINSKKFKAPSKGYYKLNIEKSMDSIGQVVTKITLDYFIEKVDEKIAELQDKIDYVEETREYFETHLDETVDLAVDNKMTPFVEDVNERLADIADVQNKIGILNKKTGWMDEIFTGLKFIAHRGFSQYYPENTLKAYFEAYRAGFSGWECDPWTTSDGIWIDMHDSTVDRTTNGTGNVQELTYDYIKSLEIDGGNNASLFKGLKVPSLEEIFDLASKMENKPLLFLNNRTDTPIDDPRTIALVNIIRKYNYEKKTVIFTARRGFYGVRKELPSVGVCADFGTDTPTLAALDELATFTPNAMASIYFNILLGVDGESLISMCKERGILIQAHTVNNESDAVKLKKIGVNSILTDVIINI